MIQIFKFIIFFLTESSFHLENVIKSGSLNGQDLNTNEIDILQNGVYLLNQPFISLIKDHIFIVKTHLILVNSICFACQYSNYFSFFKNDMLLLMENNISDNNKESTAPNENVKIIDYFTNEESQIDLSGDFYVYHIVCGKLNQTKFTKEIRLTVVKDRELSEIEFFAISIATRKCIFFFYFSLYK